MKLEGLVAIVTGGASGLGEATVIELTEKKCKVVIVDLNEEAGNSLASRLGKETAIFVKTDVTDEKACDEVVEKAVSAFGAVHILVACAGVLSVAPIVSRRGVAKSAEMMRTLKINVLGTFNISKAVALQLTKQEPLNDKGERGVIVMISSVAGLEGQRAQVCYSASKGAIIGMTLPMARDLGKYGVRVVTIAPGVFMTPMGKDLNPKVTEDIKRNTPLGRLGDPPEFAGLIACVCSNSYLTGEVIRLDGGVRLGYL